MKGQLVLPFEGRMSKTLALQSSRGRGIVRRGKSGWVTAYADSDFIDPVSARGRFMLELMTEAPVFPIFVDHQEEVGLLHCWRVDL